ncbi:MAG: hypothetical protein ACRD5J_10390 [Nitrososphaeraceae archaeon]
MITVTLLGDDIAQPATDGKTGEPVEIRHEHWKFKREVEINSWDDLFQSIDSKYDKEKAHRYDDDVQERMR